MTTRDFRPSAAVHEVPNDVWAVSEFFYRRGCTDGLPVVPPTPAAVAQMLTFTDRAPDEVVAKLAPRWGLATIEKLAINAVLAGCRPEFLPVLITAVEAIAAEEFNLYGIQATTHPCAPLLLVNGPIARELEMNAGHNAFGPGNLANATIGRALRLILLNIGGGHPGRAGQGDARSAQQVRLLCGRERGGDPLGAAPRRAGVWARAEHGDGAGGREPAQHQRS